MKKTKEISIVKNEIEDITIQETDKEIIIQETDKEIIIQETDKEIIIQDNNITIQKTDKKIKKKVTPINENEKKIKKKDISIEDDDKKVKESKKKIVEKENQKTKTKKNVELIEDQKKQKKKKEIIQDSILLNTDSEELIIPDENINNNIDYENIFNIKKAECDILYAEYDELCSKKTLLELKIKQIIEEINKIDEKCQLNDDSYTIEQKLQKNNFLETFKQDINNLDLSSENENPKSDDESDEESDTSLTLDQKIELLKAIKK